MSAAVSSPSAVRVRWSWLWGARSDFWWNFVPFWLGIALVGVLYGARDLGGAEDNPVWNFTLAGRPIHLASIVLYLYGPLVDAPHLWATIARTYTDAGEWAERRRLFIGSLIWFVVGPMVILLPYGLRALSLLPAGLESSGWLLWSNFFTFYALFHIYKQHWGFVALYRRKNGEPVEREYRVDQWFFYVAIWAPFVAMITAPWYTDYDGKPFAFTAATGGVLHVACHAVFALACLSYVGFQWLRFRQGVTRNGPKLMYLSTIMLLNYLAFSLHPLVAAFWVVTTGLGHCAQYHRVVWAYGQSKYAGKPSTERKLPNMIFDNLQLYVLLGVLFGIVTLQGFGSGSVRESMANALELGVVEPMFRFLDRHAGLELALKVVVAFVSGVRLHHFYVDSKIWRVSKTQGLAKNLNV